MVPSLFDLQNRLSPAEALALAQQAPEILSNNPRVTSASPLAFIFSTAETAELWTIYENLLLSCLRVGDDDAAHLCLDRLIRRFGRDNERVMALQGLIKEAEASNEAELVGILSDYDTILQEDGTNVPIAKRKVALLRSLNRVPDAVTALTALLEFSPTDAEAWAELADLYLSQGLYPQTQHALEEVLVLSPNAWNMHARLGEVLLMAAQANAEGGSQRYLAEALKRFCRSIELCDDYLRGYYGLKKVTDKLLGDNSKPQRGAAEEEFTAPDRATIQKLNQAATEKLSEIVRRYRAQDQLWQGYDSAEIAAAEQLLSSSTAKLVR